MTEMYNASGQKERRRLLRRNLTEAERALWFKLRNSQLNGFKFRRQFGIGPYVVDFFCPAANLVIELDGGIHTVADVALSDIERQKNIEELGLVVVRFQNEEILQNIESVILQIIPLLTKERVG